MGGQGKLFKYQIKSLLPLIGEYIVATMAYLTFDNKWKGNEMEILWSSLLQFSAAPPFYFLFYFIFLSLLSPFLFVTFKKIFANSKKELIIVETVLFLVLLFLSGYISIDRLNLLGQSYLCVYGLGVMSGFVLLRQDIHNSKWNTAKFLLALGFSLTVWLAGFFSVKRFYWARVAGNFGYSGGIDSLCPRLQMNPPNLSVLLYSAGCILIFYTVFSYCENTKCGKTNYVFKGLSLFGRYSLDIFIWHLLVQKVIGAWLTGPIDIWIKRVLYYTGMFLIPIFGKKIYEQIKKELYTACNT